MDSSMGKMCLGKDVIEISSDRNEGSGDWDSPEYKDTAGSGGKKEPEALVFHKMDTEEDSDRDEEGKPNLDDLETLHDFNFDEVPQTETDLPSMVCKIGKGSRNKKKVMENIMYFNNDVGPSSSIGIRLTQEEAEKRALAHNISMRIYEQLGRDDIMKEDKNIIMINYTEAEVTVRLELFTTFDGCTRQTFRAAKSEKIRIAESDSDDEEDYVIKRNDMGIPIHNSRPIEYQNNINPAENMTLSTLESVINPFRKISVWKKAVSFLGSLPAKVRDVEWKPDYKLCYFNPELATRNWKTKIRLTDPYGNIYMQAFVTKPTKRKLSKYYKSSTYDHEVGSSCVKRFRNVETVEEALLPDVHHEFFEWRDEIDQMLKISLKEAQSDVEDE
ncbi:hypothetical protein Tco_1159753 [Tanacetum coccineum]